MKKKLNIILIIVVISIWGSAGYRFVKNYFLPSLPIIKENRSLSAQQFTIKRDTFIMKKIDRDPFLSKYYEQPKIAVVKPNRTKTILKKPVEPAIPLVWPDVQYFGYIKSDSKKELALIKVEGKLYRLHAGESVNGLIIKNVMKDHIQTSFNKENRQFKILKNQ
jgi:type II secretory pathway component PulC